MRFGLLGPLEVVGREGGRRDPAAARQRRLLSALLVSRGESVSVDRLVEVLWPDGRLPQDPVATVRTYVTRLRTALEPDRVGGEPRIVIGGPDRYVLDVTGHEVDADAFEHDLARAVAALEAEPAEALVSLDRALARWRGPALAEVADEVWARPEAERLEGLRVTAQEHRLRCLLETGAVDRAIAGLERHVRVHPMRERPHGLLMLALDRAGRAAGASQVFHDFRERLREESGLDPSADLQELHLRVLRHSDASTFTSMAPGRWDRIPVPRISLHGRDRDVEAVWELLATRRVVTVVGAGGVGKTRLAAELAYRTLETGGETAFAELAGVSDPDGIVDAIFDALELPAVGRRDGLEGLSRLLRSHRARMILDNCEHLVDAVADLVAELSREHPDLTVLATSREPLGTQGEHVYRLASLDETSAAALFRDRMTAAGFTGTFTPSGEEQVRRICRRLDGIPLAIEFAAAGAAHLGLTDVMERLDDRLWSMGGGRRTLPRHETLEAAIAWSYDLLDDDERAVLHAAATFVNRFTVTALADVAAFEEERTLEVLLSLIRRSLVETDRTGDRPWFRLLETVRLFTLRRMQETGDAASRQQRHAEHFLRHALDVAPRIHDLPPGVDRSMCRIQLRPTSEAPDRDTSDHVAALGWLGRAHRLAELGKLAARMPTVLGQTGLLDPRHRYLGREDVAAALSEEPAELALYQTASALNACYLGRFQDALRFGRAAMSSATDPGTRSAAAALTALASTGLEPEQVADLTDRAMEEAPTDAYFTRLLLQGQRALSLVVGGQLREAVDQLEPHARLGDAFAAAEQLLVLHVLGDDDRVLEIAIPEEAYPDAAALWSYRWPLARALVHAARHQPEAAADALTGAAQHVATSPLDHDHDVLLGCAALAYHSGDAARALQLLDAVGRRVISPASFVLARHYRRLVNAAIDPSQLEPTRELASALDPRPMLDSELRRLITPR